MGLLVKNLFQGYLTQPRKKNREILAIYSSKYKVNQLSVFKIVMNIFVTNKIGICNVEAPRKNTILRPVFNFKKKFSIALVTVDDYCILVAALLPLCNYSCIFYL